MRKQNLSIVMGSIKNMNTYKIFNSKTNKTINIVKANNTLEIVKKYDLATRENSNTKIEQIYKKIN